MKSEVAAEERKGKRGYLHLSRTERNNNIKNDRQEAQKIKTLAKLMKGTSSADLGRVAMGGEGVASTISQANLTAAGLDVADLQKYKQAAAKTAYADGANDADMQKAIRNMASNPSGPQAPSSGGGGTTPP